VPNSYCSIDSSGDRIEVSITVLNLLSVPAISFESLQNVFREGRVDVSIDTNVIVVVDRDQVSELQVSMVSLTAHQALGFHPAERLIRSMLNMPSFSHVTYFRAVQNCPAPTE